MFLPSRDRVPIGEIAAAGPDRVAAARVCDPPLNYNLEHTTRFPEEAPR